MRAACVRVASTEAVARHAGGGEEEAVARGKPEWYRTEGKEKAMNMYTEVRLMVWVVTRAGRIAASEKNSFW